ncbi:AraC family transcriptional regulator [Paenibacillus qinlingensis]|uniref:AraC family transcriptional regulator n=1 Tax=Paenibacillus qinlingensis TaxID=1837343 RepID=UPI00156680C8|nr:helix-turn-helix domain-containing protein [Paenibacillus qinlingensis]NQX58774.1 helix-turn-helix domain-containing protein [Paenibacillus qinlingensis]
MNSFQMMIEALEVRFLHLTQYQLDYHWQAKERKLRHCVLWFVHKGSFQLTIDQTAFRCKEGQIIILPAHSLISFHAISDDLLLTSINFDAEISLVSNRGWVQLLNIPLVYEDNTNSIERIIHEMHTAERNATSFVHLLQQSSLLRIIYELLHHGGVTEQSTNYSQLDKRIHTIIHYLHAHPQQMPEINELAELVQLSDSHLRKLFIKQTGQAPLHFVHSIKIEQAKKLLATSEKPVSQISYELGIENANYFSRMFKIKTGLTPLQYRQQFGLWLND